MEENELNRDLEYVGVSDQIKDYIKNDEEEDEDTLYQSEINQQSISNRNNRHQMYEQHHQLQQQTDEDASNMTTIQHTASQIPRLGESQPQPIIGGLTMAVPFDDHHQQQLYQALFDVFDRERVGAIEPHDLNDIAVALDKDPEIVIKAVQSMDVEESAVSGDLMKTHFSFPEFVKIMKCLEQNSGDKQYQVRLKKEFGNMLPRNSVYFMPDFKVLEVLKVLNDCRRKQEKDLKYVDAQRTKQHIKAISDREFQRQKGNMEEAQRQEFEEVETQQKAQFIGFSRAWDQYMQDYEAAATASINRLKDRQQQELHLKTQDLQGRLTELMKVRQQERLMFQVRDLQKAEELRRQGDAMESFERQRIEEASMLGMMGKEEQKLRQSQQAQLKSFRYSYH